MNYKPTLEQAATTVRIVDIARMAGVSTGTVDRVIHNRGKVSDENLARVRAVLREMNYRPNLLARSLASGRQYTVCVLVPGFAPGEYWADVDAGVSRAADELARFNITVRRLHFDQYDRCSFERLLRSLQSEEPDAVLVATLFSEMVIPFAQELDARGIPCVFVDSDIPSCNRLAYFGTSSYDAGRLAARLLTERMDPAADIVVGKIAHRGDAGSNQWHNRELGFRDCLTESGFRGRLLEVSLSLEDHTRNTGTLDALFASAPNVGGAVTFNSTCYILGRYLKAADRRDVRLVGYDLIARNEQMLSEGYVTALIAQRPEAQGYYGVKALYECLVGGGAVEQVNQMPIDILLKENIQFYKNNPL